MKLNEFNNAFQTEQDCLKYIARHKLVKFTPIIFNLDSMISLNN
ncbi:hypothetical protein [Spiroplasma ixodetis]|nr:hypothetical protein [Spiroplasma ixodetis]